MVRWPAQRHSYTAQFQTHGFLKVHASNHHSICWKNPGALLPWLRKYPETAELARYPPTREELQKTSLPKGRCQHTAAAINPSKSVSTGDGKKFTSVPPTPGNTAWGQIIRWQRPIPRGKGEWVPGYPAVAGPSWRNLFLYSNTQRTEVDLHDRKEEGGDWERDR